MAWRVMAWLLPPRPAGRTRSMWGLAPGCTSSRTLGLTGSMDAMKRRSEVVNHLAEPGLERRAPSDQHVIVAGAKRRGWRDADKFAQATPHAVAFHRIADLLGDGEPDPRRPSLGAQAGLQDEGARRRSRASCGSLGGGPKVIPAFQPLHETDIRTVLNRNGDRRTPIARRVQLRHLISYGRARGARPKPCGRLWSPCGRESHGGACEPICSAGRSVSRGLSPLRNVPAALRLASGP
jgi:hypothetical protein